MPGCVDVGDRLATVRFGLLAPESKLPMLSSPNFTRSPADDSESLGTAVTHRLTRVLGFRAGVGVPVSVEGRLWGVMMVGSLAGPLPAGTEARLAGFCELAGTAIANAEAQAELTASRARSVATADATRRRIERDLHDGAQQRLVSLALDLRAAEAAVTGGVAQQLDRIAAGMDGVLADLRDIACGLNPAILAESGLRAALKTLARRSAVPVSLDIQVVLEDRLPPPTARSGWPRAFGWAWRPPIAVKYNVKRERDG